MTATNGIGEMWRHKRVLAASLIGTAVEFYDFYIYATAASLIFPALFFPASSPTAQLMASYGSLALAFFARPLGAAVFGHYGDRVGRKATLVTSLMLMGGCTLAIGFLPTHAQIGWWAPLILCLLRFGQGLGLGGEWGGAALLALVIGPIHDLLLRFIDEAQPLPGGQAQPSHQLRQSLFQWMPLQQRLQADLALGLQRLA